MAELKTKRNDKDPNAFIGTVENETRRRDALQLLDIMKGLTGERAEMWGPSIIGFGTMTYTNTTGANEWMMIGFSPRKQSLTVYFMNGFKKYEEQLSRLGKHKHSKSCLYINKLSDVDIGVLKEMIADSIDHIRSGKPFEY